MNELNLQRFRDKNEINIRVPICLKNLIVNSYNTEFYSNFILILTYIRNKTGPRKIDLVTINNNQIKQYLKIIIDTRSYQNIYFILYRCFDSRIFVFSPIDKDLSRTIKLDNIIILQETNIAQAKKYHKGKQIEINLYLNTWKIDKITSKNYETILKL